MVVATGREASTSGSRYPAYSSSLAWPVLLTWSPAEMMKFRSGFCCAAISRVRFQPKLSFRAAVLAAPESAFRDSLP